MPLTKANIEYVLTRLIAAGQRQDEVRRMVDLLRDKSWWRSADGKLAVEMTPAQQIQLEEFMVTYAKELHEIAFAIEELVAPESKAKPTGDAV